MTITGINEIELKDILVGEVWLCGGQSNMATTLKGYADQEELEQIDFPNIRLFKVEMHSTDEPQEDCQGSWTRCDPTSAAEFAANGYYFGKHLHSQLQMPVGLIHDCVSGTPGEAWASPETIADPVYTEFVDNFETIRNGRRQTTGMSTRNANRQVERGRTCRRPQTRVRRAGKRRTSSRSPSGLQRHDGSPIQGKPSGGREGNQGRAHQ